MTRAFVSTMLTVWDRSRLPESLLPVKLNKQSFYNKHLYNGDKILEEAHIQNKLSRKDTMRVEQ